MRATLIAEFGFTEKEANGYLIDAYVRSEKKNYGSGNEHLLNSGTRFASEQAAKDFARQKMATLEYEVQKYNIGVKLWSPEKIIEQRQDWWQKSYEHRLDRNGGDEAEAIKWADDSLKKLIEAQNSGSGVALFSGGLGGLQAGFGALPANLITENADGTLSINYDSLKNTTLGNLLNIGSNIGQQVDQAA